jgi:hypothetical protein
VDLEHPAATAKPAKLKHKICLIMIFPRVGLKT